MAKTFNTIKTESSTNVWLTPRNVLDLLGDFDTDPCAATIRPWDCARVNYTVEDNGLILPWKGRVWLNPPYDNEIEPFLKRMSEHIGGGVLLLYLCVLILVGFINGFSIKQNIYFCGRGELSFVIRTERAEELVMHLVFW